MTQLAKARTVELTMRNGKKKSPWSLKDLEPVWENPQERGEKHPETKG